MNRVVALNVTVLCLGFFHSPAAAQVRFEVRHDSVAIGINGRPFSVLHFGKEARKPFLHPLLTAAGNAVTRGFPASPLPGDSTDRPNHRGLTIGAQRLKGPARGLTAGVFFWGQNFFDNDPSNAGPDKATIAFKEVTGAESGAERGTLSTVAHWISHQGQLWLIERRRMTFYGTPADSRIFDIDLELEAAEEIAFSDQSAMLGLRLGLPFDDHYGGRVVNAAGGVNEEGVRGRRSPHLVWTATLPSGEKVGVAVLDHPNNLNHPARWHVRGKGFLMANPFDAGAAETADPNALGPEYAMKRGGKLRLRYRIAIQPEGRSIDALWKEFTRP